VQYQWSMDDLFPLVVVVVVAVVVVVVVVAVVVRWFSVTWAVSISGAWMTCFRCSSSLS